MVVTLVSLVSRASRRVYPSRRHRLQISSLWYLLSFWALPVSESYSLHCSPIAQYRTSATLPIGCGAGFGLWSERPAPPPFC
jgi:hypothetical protein